MFELYSLKVELELKQEVTSDKRFRQDWEVGSSM